jgi:hypothetical protein
VQGQTQSTSLSLSAPHPTYVDVTEVFNLSCTSCGTTETGFLSFNNQFSEVAEPSTFGLIGTALALFGALTLRTRKLQA